ncbi:MAG: flagellar hook protein FlgE [Thiobacillaceae bacterium]|nr:flagellar hook protein FlgE [Thiobacillaceae bacterium]
MSFQQGLSGLNGAAKSLDVIGNNIANVATVGFKSSRVEFADIYANSLFGTGGLQPGIGVQVAAINQQFSQGNIAITDNPLDIAINGNGFFLLDDGGARVYSRNGQFQLDREGYIVSNTGQRLMGLTNNTFGPLQIVTFNNAPQSTSRIELAINLDANAAVPSTAFSHTNPASYNHTTAMAVYDSLGNAHTLSFYFRRTSTPLQWEVYATVTNTAGATTLLTPTPIGNLSFNADGSLATSTASALTIPATALATGANPITLASGDLDFTGTTQYGAAFGIYSAQQNGYATGQLAGISVADDGLILGRYTNGQTQALGQIVLTNFPNPNGLLPIGNNLWVETSASGQPLNPQAPGSPNLGTLRSGAVEESNVDLTQELVNLIVAQRVYQANAQTIRAQDQVLQTLVNLR